VNSVDKVQTADIQHIQKKMQTNSILCYQSHISLNGTQIQVVNSSTELRLVTLHRVQSTDPCTRYHTFYTVSQNKFPPLNSL